MKRSNLDKFTIILIIIILVLGASALLLWSSSIFLEKDSKKQGNQSNSNEPKTSIKSKLEIELKKKQIKEQHPSIIYESSNIPGFISYIIEENEKTDSILLNTTTGEEIKFHDLIKSDKINSYRLKEKELLLLKYPEFIVSGIENSNGSKRYEVKDDMVTVFYDNYTYDYDYEKVVSLKIDYNEIKDYLVFEPKLNETYANENGYQYEKGKKTIALTFDDGPSGKYNSLILEELEKNKAHATFFMVGNMMNNCRSCVLNTYNKGQEIGSHTYEHMNIKKGKIENVKTSLQKTDDIYYSITKEHINLLRPPYGAYTKENLENINNYFILWDLDTEDWRYRDVDHIVNYIKENAEDGSIILMHELYETSYESLKIILPWLYSEGYQVVSVSELANLKDKTLEYGSAYLSFK